MRGRPLVVWPALAALLIASSSVAAAPGDSPSIARVVHEPTSPPRDRSVDVTMVPVPTANVSAARLVYCRVQHYACAPTLIMTRSSDGLWHATIPWTARFFDGVTTVGYRMDVTLSNGSIEHTPIRHTPQRPADLPPEGDVYYYYGLPAATTTPSSGAWLVLLVVAVVAMGGRR
jgi:hypothetical protein